MNTAAAAASDSTYDSKRWPAMIVKRKHNYDRAAGGAELRELPISMPVNEAICERDVSR